MELNVTTRKSFNEILDKQIKSYSKKGWHTKWNLWNNTRFDFKIKTQHHRNKLLWSRMRNFHRFMLSWPFNICFWKLIFKQINISTNFWRWFHSKRMHHCFLINFLKSVVRIASYSVRIAHCFCNIYHFFLFLFLNWFFFFPFSKPSILQNPEVQKFLMCILIFISKISQNRMMENRGFCKSGNKNRMIYQRKHNGVSVRNLCGSNTQIWTQTKNKKHQRIKNTADFRSSIYTKNKKQISQNKYY